MERNCPFGLTESGARNVLTLDKDFWQIAVQRRMSLEHSGVVLFRVHPATSGSVGPLVRSFVESNRTWARHITTITVDGIQMSAARKN